MNAKLGTIRYLAWIIIGCPKDTPIKYARWVALAAALEMMFNHGLGSVEQRMRAAMWLLEAEEVSNNDPAGQAVATVKQLLRGDDTQEQPDTGAEEA